MDTGNSIKGLNLLSDARGLALRRLSTRKGSDITGSVGIVSLVSQAVRSHSCRLAFLFNAISSHLFQFSIVLLFIVSTPGFQSLKRISSDLYHYTKRLNSFIPSLQILQRPQTKARFYFYF